MCCLDLFSVFFLLLIPELYWSKLPPMLLRDNKRILYLVIVVIKTLDGIFCWKITNPLTPPHLGPRPTAFWFWSQTILRTASFDKKNIKSACLSSWTCRLLLLEMGCLSFWSISHPTFHTARGRVPLLWRSSLWSKPSCKSMCTVSRTASTLHNQHFKAALSIIRLLGAFARAFHFSGPCWVSMETVCSWHHLLLRGFMEFYDLRWRDLWIFFPLATYLRGIGYDLEDVSSFICKASSLWLVKFLQSPWIITSIHFLAIVPALNLAVYPSLKHLEPPQWCLSAHLEIRMSH